MGDDERDADRRGGLSKSAAIAMMVALALILLLVLYLGRSLVDGTALKNAPPAAAATGH